MFVISAWWTPIHSLHQTTPHLWYSRPHFGEELDKPVAPSDLGDNENLYKDLSDSSLVTEWSDNDVTTCTEDRSTFDFDLSQKSLCTDGNCRVEFILLYPDDSIEFESITWIDTSDTSKTTLKGELTIETEDNYKILIPEEVLLRSLSIDFGQNRKICEIIVAGINAEDYKCSEGKFLNTESVQCEDCPAGQYGDVKGLGECKKCAENERTDLPNTGSTKCTPCDYLQYSNVGSSTCQPCDGTTLTKPACLLSQDQTTNLVSTDIGTPELRSLDQAVVGDYDLLDTASIPLVPENKPFYIYSVVLVAKNTEDQSILDELIINSRKKELNYPAGTAVFTVEESGVESLTVRTAQTVKLQKLFVFGIPFRDALAPEGHRNTGTQFEKCLPGTYSPGGSVKACTQCQANQEQPAPGQTTCSNCKEGYYSAVGAASCIKCGPETLECKTACQSLQEEDEMYGNYSWPTTLAGERVKIHCIYNKDPEVMAYKQCDLATKNFGQTNFESCNSKVHEQINKIQEEADNLVSKEGQKEVSVEILSVTEENSDVMNSDDVKKTSEIIDKLIEFDEAETLDEEVRNNILKTVDGVHKSTNANEISRGDVASSMRSSVEKLTNKMSKDSTDSEDAEPIYVKEQSMGVVVSKTTGDDTSFTVSGDQSDYTNTNLGDSAGDKKPLLFSVKVPANDKKSAITAILYDTPKFYPDKLTVEDFTSALAEQFTSPNRSKKAMMRVVSMVTEIKYAESTENVEFKSGKEIELKYSVKEEKPKAHYKMALKQSYECVFYNTDNDTWVTGEKSGCITKEEIGSNGEKLVSCQCSHMTSFAVLMSFDSDYDPLEETVTSILLGISLGCLFFTIIAYLPAKEMLRTRSVRINLLLVTSLMFSIIVFYFMELVVTTNVKENHVPSENDSPSFPCVIVAFLMNYFWLCQMAWMVCEALVMYRALVSAVMDSHIHRYMLKFNLACWGIPLIFPIIGIIWGQTDFANPKTCFLRQKYGLVTFYAPVILCILFNIFIFIRIAWSIFRKQNMETGKKPVSDLERRKKQFKFAITVMTLLGVAWIFGFFLIIEGANTIWLRYLFIIFNSTQGIFIFFLYVVMNDNLKKVWRKLLNISDSDKPSHSSVPYSRSKGPGTKQTFAATNTKSISEMDPLSTATTSTRSKTSNVTVVSEYERSRSTSPRSTLMTTSLVSPEKNVYKNGPGGVHIYDNVASIISESLEKKVPLSNRSSSNFDQISSKNYTNVKHRRT